MMRGLLDRWRTAGSARDVAGQLWVCAIWAVTAWFVCNVLALIASVLVSSFGSRWLRSWLPDGWTARWYSDFTAGADVRALCEAQIDQYEALP